MESWSDGFSARTENLPATHLKYERQASVGSSLAAGLLDIAFAIGLPAEINSFLKSRSRKIFRKLARP
jgi:hypothetical protein